MSVEMALSDRLYAQALGWYFREPDQFRSTRPNGSWASLEDEIRKRALSLAKELRVNPAQVEAALEAARKRWQKTVGAEESPRLVRLLVLAGSYLLQQDGREMILQVERETPGREILRWRFVTLF